MKPLMACILRRCPVPGCEQYRDGGMLMCRDHWRLVPQPLRDEVWRTHRAKDTAGWCVAAREAIRLAGQP